jgi:hypothetical protein
MDELEVIEGAELEAEGAELETEGAETETAEGESGAQAGATETIGAASTWKQVKERLKDSPDLHRQVKQALHFMEDANKRMPDGIAKAAERLELISHLDDNPEDPEYVPGSTPIEQVISNTLAERGFWRDYDTAFQAADPKIINQMIEANPASFQKLIPQAMDRFAEVNPEGFSAYVCKSVSGYLNSAQIPLQLALLERVLPPDSDDPGLKTVIEAFKAIKGVVEQINTTAAKPIEPKAGAAAAATQQPGNDLEQREINVRAAEWVGPVRQISEKFTVAEVQKIAPKTRFTPTEINSIRSAVGEEINARLRANTAYVKKATGFVKANNRAAWSMTVESEHKKIIPGAVKRAVDDVLAKRKTAQAGKVKPGAQQTQQGAKPGQQQQTQQTSGKFEYIAQSPSRLGLKVDLRRTSNEMLARNEAFVVGRTAPVKWKQRVVGY